MLKTLTSTAAFCLACLTGTAQANEITPHQFKVLGTWNSLSQYKNYEAPFWTETLPAETDGKLRGDIVSISVMGMKGYETLNLLQNGVFDMGNMVVAYVTGSTPEMEGIDLAGVATDMSNARANADAYRDVINQRLAEQNLIMLAHYPFGRQFVFCKEEFDGLAGLKGRKIRTSSATHADFLTGAGATNVTIPFGEVVPAIQNGVVDCAVTGAIPAYDASWHEVIGYVSELPINMGMAGLYANLAKWNALDEGTRSAMAAKIESWEDSTWTNYVTEENEGLACLTGDNAGCSKGDAVDMTLIPVSDADTAAAREVLQSDVFPGWLERCGKANCAGPWNATIGASNDLSIQ
ncbi:TRAP-type C4-dicarboxylate transport system substrate-binding protein [Labrenzia sp. EL_208]|nr:TRAP-type C4-dicarboxylate transport system substrate-binding protein [Labrenzia sp. EL_142]MBG6173608.1 TRAP-type C4-dicarboxylate transport system substrate-binding protein [Labrenzia sp. EL_132]MBG6211033.1 TRAP-type C4-dicarboxylate transport system substrate-binding protein [Labrenzia sp. EL_126]MBG6227622.1 TRAP-type C4-dicarboxylate transport system substrate-binding protein [Labrenzia sp. EL_208]